VLVVNPRMSRRLFTPLNRRLLLSLAVVLAGATVMGQAPLADRITNGFLNGRFWEKETDDEKLAFMEGFVTGLSAARSLAEQYVAPLNKQRDELRQHLVDAGLLVQISPPEGAKTPETLEEAINSQFIAEKFTYADYIKEIDKLYSDRENIRLPIPVAIQYCALKLRGTATTAELEQFLIRRRKTASASEEKNP
jgi:hypothetical protein